jgi:hypothetical protein
LSPVHIEGAAVKVDQLTASTFGLGRRQLAHKTIYQRNWMDKIIGLYRSRCLMQEAVQNSR